MVFLFINLLLPNIKGSGSSWNGDRDINDCGFTNLTGPFKSIAGARNLTFAKNEDPNHGNGTLSWDFSLAKANALFIDGGTIRPKSLSILVLLKL